MGKSIGISTTKMTKRREASSASLNKPHNKKVFGFGAFIGLSIWVFNALFKCLVWVNQFQFGSRAFNGLRVWVFNALFIRLCRCVCAGVLWFC